MSRVAGAVHLITTQGEAGKGGLTATAFASVSDAPPMVLVCLNRASRTASMITQNGFFAVNTLSADQSDLADIFSGRGSVQGEDRFKHGQWQAGIASQPVLSGALLHFVVKLAEIKPVASHDIVIGEVLGIELCENRPGLVYARRGYHSI
jgi:flavin reductase